MADHLILPAPITRTSRRSRPRSAPTPPENRAAHGTRLLRQLEDVRSLPPARVVDGVDPRHVFKIRTDSPLLDQQFRARQLEPLGETSGWTYVVLPLDDGDDLASVLNAYTHAAQTDSEDTAVPLRSLIDRIEDIARYGRTDRLAPEVATALEQGAGPHTVDVLLWPSTTRTESRRRLADVRAVIERLGGTMRGRDETPSTTAVRVECSDEALHALAELAVVTRVRPPLAPMIEPSTWLTAQLQDFEPPEPLDAVVGVIDDGVATGHPLLRGLVIEQREFPPTHPWSAFGAHGTLVAGLAAYGGFETALVEAPRSNRARLQKPVRLVVARVLEPAENSDSLATRFPSDAPEHSTIAGAIRWMHREHNVRVVNLSITEPSAFHEPHASLWTATLDALVRELDIVIVVAAGNQSIPREGALPDGSHVLDDYPSYLTGESHRLAEPATAANVVTVGSLGISDATATASGASHLDVRPVAGRDRPSPFSRAGPGIVGKMKPDVVHDGGDVAFSGAAGAQTSDFGLGSVSLNSAPAERIFRSASGNSFAAARVSNLAARTWERYPEASANLIRCLIGLSSEHPRATESLMPSEEMRHLAIGYGRPDLELATDSGRQRVVMTHQGEMACDTACVHQFPVPRDFAIGASQRSISVALAFDPPVRWQRRDYLAGVMELGLYRNVDPVRLADQLSSGDAGDLPRDRRWLGGELRPTQTLTTGSTLIVRRWIVDSARALNPDDGDMYSVSVTHRARPWASGLADAPNTQRYALAVELWDRERLMDVYRVAERQLVHHQVEVRARLQAREAAS